MSLKVGFEELFARLSPANALSPFHERSLPLSDSEADVAWNRIHANLCALHRWHELAEARRTGMRPLSAAIPDASAALLRDHKNQLHDEFGRRLREHWHRFGLVAEKAPGKTAGWRLRRVVEPQANGGTLSATSGSQSITTEKVAATDNCPKVPAKEDASATPSAQRGQAKRTSHGGARLKLIAALTKHHQYDVGSCQNSEPVGVRELAKAADVGIGTTSDFFKQQFNGHDAYAAMCRRSTSKLVQALKMLNGEYTPSLLYGRDPQNTESDE